MVIRVRDIVDAADTGDQGSLVYESISALIANGESVIVSFDGVRTATSSFVNVAFVPLLELLDFDALKRHLKVVQSTPQINEMIKTRLSREAVKAELASRCSPTQLHL